MKKLFTLLVAAIMVGSVVSAAATNDSTYTEKFIKKHTQGIVDKEKSLNTKVNKAKEKQKAEKEAAKKRQAEQKKKLQQKKDAINTLKSW